MWQKANNGAGTLLRHLRSRSVLSPTSDTQKRGSNGVTGYHDTAIAMARIQNLDKKNGLHEKKRTRLQDLFRTLLHELMTAKTRVPDLDLEKEAIA